MSSYGGRSAASTSVMSPANACVVRDANVGHQLAGGNSSWCPELESRDAPLANSSGQIGRHPLHHQPEPAQPCAVPTVSTGIVEVFTAVFDMHLWNII